MTARPEGAVTLPAATFVAYTEWCAEPDDHCLRGDCHYGNHGPLTPDAEGLLRGGGYGDYVDEYLLADQRAPSGEPAEMISARDIEWAQSMTGSVDADSSPAYYSTMSRVFDAARQSAADRATLAAVTQLVATATGLTTTLDQARAHLARIRTELAAAGHLPSEPTDPNGATRRIVAPFAGTELDRSPALAASRLQLQADGTRFALILSDRMLSTVNRTTGHPAVMLDDAGTPQVWLAGHRLDGFDERLVWARVAAGQEVHGADLQAKVGGRIHEAERALPR